jgi:hypothetical protein
MANPYHHEGHEGSSRARPHCSFERHICRSPWFHHLLLTTYQITTWGRAFGTEPQPIGVFVSPNGLAWGRALE